MSPEQPPADYFERALLAADRIDRAEVHGDGIDLDIVLRALRESLLLQKGMRAEITGLRQRLQDGHKDVSLPETLASLREALLAGIAALDEAKQRAHPESKETDR